MSLIAKQPESNVEILPSGTHHAVCYSVIDVGHQLIEYKGQEKIQHKIIFFWEFPKIRIDWEKEGETKNLPRIFSKTYTFSLHEKANLTKDLIAWRGKLFTMDEWAGGFDTFMMIGKNCLLQIVHKVNQAGTKTYANIASIAQIMSGMKEIVPESEIIKYSMIDDGIANFPEDKVPEWVTTKFKESQEYQAVLRAKQNPELAAASGDFRAKEEQMANEQKAIEGCDRCGKPWSECACDVPF